MDSFEMPRLRTKSGEANFTLSKSVVPALTPETFNPDKATEEREIVEATISGIQRRKRVAELEAQFNMNIGYMEE